LSNIFWENILFDLKKIYSRMYFEKIYCLIWREFIVEYILRIYTVRFFDLKKIYCRIYFEKIYCLIWRKFLVQYILRKYTVSFEEKWLPNIFWENILFDLKKTKKEWWVKHKRYDQVNRRKTTLGTLWQK